jgi:hypothetical protein
MGHHIMYKSIRLRFGAIDFDGKFDIVSAKRIDGGHVQWFFTQCKSVRMYGKEKQVLVDWLHTYGFAGINCMIAVKTKQGRKTVIEWHTLA